MLTIEKYSHFIKIKPPNYEVSELLTAFAANYVTRSFIKENGKQVLKPTHVYASRTKDKKEYHFHVNQLDELLNFLQRRGVDVSYVDIQTKPLHDPVMIDVMARPEWVLREYQDEAANYIASDHPRRTKLLELQTGSGKTVSALFGIHRKGYRTIIVILPQYIEKWLNDVRSVFEIPIERIMVVQGSAHLKGLISLAQEDELQADFIIISSRTFQNFITDYEIMEDYDYQIPPDELFPLLKAGTLLIDETHQHLHAMFKVLLYTHIHLMIGLTATLITDSYDVKVIHDVMYPPDVRFNNLEMDRYTDVYAFTYTTHDFKNSKLRTQEWGNNTYSHNAYEKSILARRDHTENYMKIIDFCVGHSFLDIYQKGDKLAIFASSIKMCDAMTKFLKRKYGHRFDIRRYCEDDPYENAIEPDIRVTTIQSMGTAIDIPGLRTVILTNAISSVQANIQVLGRLRKLPDRDVRFVFLTNEDIRQHVLYARRKKELFTGRVKSYKSLRLPIGM